MELSHTRKIFKRKKKGDYFLLGFQELLDFCRIFCLSFGAIGLLSRLISCYISFQKVIYQYFGHCICMKFGEYALLVWEGCGFYKAWNLGKNGSIALMICIYWWNTQLLWSFKVRSWILQLPYLEVMSTILCRWMNSSEIW